MPGHYGTGIPFFIARNQNTKSPKTYLVDSYTNCTVSADQVKRWTGFDFSSTFPKTSSRIASEQSPSYHAY